MSSKVEHPTTLSLNQSTGSLGIHGHNDSHTGGTPEAEKHVHFEEAQLSSRQSTLWPRHNTNLYNTSGSSNFRRKRSYSFSWGFDHGGWLSAGSSNINGSGGARYKRRRTITSQNFLMGGSITDPLNLTALEPSEYELSRGNAVPVVIPANINDPLNLDASSDTEEVLVTGKKLLGQVFEAARRRRKGKRRKRRHSEPGGLKASAVAVEYGTDPSASADERPTRSSANDSTEDLRDTVSHDNTAAGPSTATAVATAPAAAAATAQSGTSKLNQNANATFDIAGASSRRTDHNFRGSKSHHHHYHHHRHHRHTYLHPPKLFKSISTSAIEGRVSRIEGPADVSTEEESVHGDTSLEGNTTCGELDKSPCKLVVVEKEHPDESSVAEDSDASNGRAKPLQGPKENSSTSHTSSSTAITSQPGGPSTGSPGLAGAVAGGSRSSKRHSFDASSGHGNKIVSPVIPQVVLPPSRAAPRDEKVAPAPVILKHQHQEAKKPVQFNPNGEKFQYGNYLQYYGYRNPVRATDMRLACLNPRWFDGREVLDIGCNIGHVTLTVARDFNPRSVTGIDIDKKLVTIANKNVRHYFKPKEASRQHQFSRPPGKKYPRSFEKIYDRLPTEREMNDQIELVKVKPEERNEYNEKKRKMKKPFPYNVSFFRANYVPETEELLEMVRPEYDLILCLSVTKWVHLNWGDEGLKRFFRRTFLNLKPGGRLVLEPQPWASYTKRKKLTPTIFENYKNIKLLPDMFETYLLREVGFIDCHHVATPAHSSKGFQRPIQVYTKEGDNNSELQEPEYDLSVRHSVPEGELLRRPPPPLGPHLSAHYLDNQSGPPYPSDFHHPYVLENYPPYPSNLPMFSLVYRTPTTPFRCWPFSPYPSPSPRVGDNSSPRMEFPDNSQSSPQYSETSPAYAPSFPTYAPSSPQQSSDSPHSSGQSPHQYIPSSSRGSPNSPNYSPHLSPRYSPSSPNYEASPGYSPSSNHGFLDPTYRRWHPSYQPSASPYSVASPHQSGLSPNASPHPPGSSPNASPHPSSPHSFASPHPYNPGPSGVGRPSPSSSPSNSASPHSSHSHLHAASASPRFYASPHPFVSPHPSVSPHAAVSPHPSASPHPLASPSPSASPHPFPSPHPSASPNPSASPHPSASPYPFASPHPSASLNPSPHPYVSPHPSTSPHSSTSVNRAYASHRPASHPLAPSASPQSSASPRPAASPYPLPASPHHSSTSPHLYSAVGSFASSAGASPHTTSSVSPHPSSASPQEGCGSGWGSGTTPSASPGISSSNLCCSPPASGGCTSSSSPLYSGGSMCPPFLPPFLPPLPKSACATSSSVLIASSEQESSPSSAATAATSAGESVAAASSEQQDVTGGEHDSDAGRSSPSGVGSNGALRNFEVNVATQRDEVFSPNVDVLIHSNDAQQSHSHQALDIDFINSLSPSARHDEAELEECSPVVHHEDLDLDIDANSSNNDQLLESIPVADNTISAKHFEKEDDSARDCIECKDENSKSISTTLETEQVSVNFSAAVSERTIPSGTEPDEDCIGASHESDDAFTSMVATQRTVISGDVESRDCHSGNDSLNDDSGNSSMGDSAVIVGAMVDSRENKPTDGNNTSDVEDEEIGNTEMSVTDRNGDTVDDDATTENKNDLEDGENVNINESVHNIDDGEIGGVTDESVVDEDDGDKGDVAHIERGMDGKC